MALRSSSFLETIIAFLLPYFIGASRDKHEARSEILDTLTSYETRTRAEMLQAAHIIAFGMTTLDVLAEAKTADMSQSMRLRYRGCANSLNRSTLQTEKALDQRLARELPPVPAEMPEPVDDMREAEIMAAIQQFKAKIDSQRPRAHPATGPHFPPDQTVGPGTLGQRDAGLVAAARRSGPTLPIERGLGRALRDLHGPTFHRFLIASDPTAAVPCDSQSSAGSDPQLDRAILVLSNG